VFFIADKFYLKASIAQSLYVEPSLLKITSEKIMSKGQKSNKEDKKKPAMTPKEKKEKKKSKK